MMVPGRSNDHPRPSFTMQGATAEFHSLLSSLRAGIFGQADVLLAVSRGYAQGGRARPTRPVKVIRTTCPHRADYSRWW